ncbi:MAG TPA: hypothetical protein VK464_22370 [Symbiobacteriaceae bacterium]|jgi:hypothetical protein|nr:hypothetical protein [Symbiobacteriaceae bacterium]
MSFSIPLDRGHSPRTNLDRITTALGRGLLLPVQVEGSSLIGFVTRLDDAPFGPQAVVQVPDTLGMRVLYRDPDELLILQPGDTLRIP